MESLCVQNYRFRNYRKIIKLAVTSVSSVTSELKIDVKANAINLKTLACTEPEQNFQAGKSH
jgi:hypothetical protein